MCSYQGAAAADEGTWRCSQTDVCNNLPSFLLFYGDQAEFLFIGFYLWVLWLAKRIMPDYRTLDLFSAPPGLFVRNVPCQHDDGF